MRMGCTGLANVYSTKVSTTFAFGIDVLVATLLLPAAHRVGQGKHPKNGHRMVERWSGGCACIERLRALPVDPADVRNHTMIVNR